MIWKVRPTPNRQIARGFLPSEVRSRHWIADPGFREPLAQWCLDEREAVRRYAQELQAHSPFRADRQET